MEDVVRLWTVDVDSVDLDRLLSLLSGAERARAAKLASAGPRRRFVAARATLRTALGQLTGASPAALVLSEGEHGKPELVDGEPLRFNVSHSGRLALVAVAGGRDVGVDVERVRPRARLDAIAARSFAATEREALAGASEEDRLELFYALWTAREAFVKATGRGLAAQVESFQVPPPPAGAESPVAISEHGLPAPRFWLRRLAPAPGYSAALAVAGEGWQVEHCATPAP